MMRRVLMVGLMLILLITLATSVSGDTGAYEGVILQHTYNVTIEDVDGNDINVLEHLSNIFPVNSTVNFTFWLQSGDDDTDIDYINISFDHNLEVNDISDLSNSESGSYGDWNVTNYVDSIVYEAVTDDESENDDAIDRGEDLCLMLSVKTPIRSGFSNISVRLMDLMNNPTETVKEYQYLLTIVNEEDTFTFIHLSYPKWPFYLLTMEGVNKLGTDINGTVFQTLPNSSIFMRATDTVHQIFIDESQSVTNFVFKVSNPWNQSMELRLRVYLFTISSISEAEEYLFIINETTIPRVSTIVWMMPYTIYEYKFAESLYGSYGGWFLNDLDDDDDGWSDDVELYYQTDPRNMFDYPTHAKLDGSVTPKSGGNKTIFTFYLSYTQTENAYPDNIYLHLDGNQMVLEPIDNDSDMSDGKLYYIQVRNLSVGEHTYYFEAFTLDLSYKTLNQTLIIPEFHGDPVDNEDETDNITFFVLLFVITFALIIVGVQLVRRRSF